MHEQLHSDDELSVFLTIEDDEVLRLELVSKTEAMDLSVVDEVVVAMGGDPVKVALEDPEHAVAELGAAEDLEDESFTLILRVYEFMGRWDFGPEVDE